MSTLSYRGPRVPVAIVSNAPAPYRVHVHERIVREMPDVDLMSAFLVAGNIQNWKFGSLSHIGAVTLDEGGTLNDAHGVRGLWRGFKQGVRLIREFRRRGTQAIVVSGYASVECIMSILWGRLTGVPVLMTADSNIASDTLTGAKRLAKSALVRTVVKAVRGILPCGQMGRAYYKKYGARDEAMWNYPYVSDPALIADISYEQVETTMEKFGLDPDRKRMVCSGRLVHDKGFDLAIDAFNQVADDRPEWDLVIAGEGALRKDLEARVRPDLKDRVIWTGFIADSTDMAALYRASHVLVHPARREPWGVIINEALIARMAIIASNVTGAAADLVEDGVNGYSIPSEDLPALVEALLDTTLPVRLAQFRRGAESRIEDWSTESDAVDGLRKALRSVGVLPASRPAVPSRGVLAQPIAKTA